MTQSKLKNVISVILEEIEHEDAITQFMDEFANFDVKEEKQRASVLASRLKELNRDAATNLYKNENKDAIRYTEAKREYIALIDKIKRFETIKPHIDSLAHKNKNFILTNYGKFV